MALGAPLVHRVPGLCCAYPTLVVTMAEPEVPPPGNFASPPMATAHRVAGELVGSALGARRALDVEAARAISA